MSKDIKYQTILAIAAVVIGIAAVAIWRHNRLPEGYTWIDIKTGQVVQQPMGAE